VSPPPVRTNLDERMSVLRGMMERFFEMVHDAYSIAFQTDRIHEAVEESATLRDDAATHAERLAQELLLVLTLNQPLLQDLRIIAASLRSVDVLERLARHARDIAGLHRDWQERAKEGAAIPEDVNTGLHKMHSIVLDLLMMAKACHVDGDDVPVETILTLHRELNETFSVTIEHLLEESKSQVAGREGRLLLATTARRLERSGYNLMRLFDLWHHAKTNTWIRFESRGK